MQKLIILFILTLFLTGCGDSNRVRQTAPAAMQVTSPTDTYTLLPTKTPTHTNTPVSNGLSTPQPTITPIEAPTLTPSRIPLPTFIPTIALGKIPGRLKSAFTMRSVAAFNGHPIQQITGWRNGFVNHQWLDSNHLMLHPIVGQGGETGNIFESYPAVINLDTQSVWIPDLDGEHRWDVVDGRLPRWSSNLGILITRLINSDGEFVVLYDFEGNYLSSYFGKLLGVSPSGTKILIADDTWVDLATGELVDFAWYQKYEGYLSRTPIWSTDEMRVYMCCSYYGDASTGESYHISPPMEHAYGEWVLDDTFLLVQWSWIEDMNPGFVPLFDPAAKTYRDLSALADIHAESESETICPDTYPSPDGQYVWVVCFDGSHLVELATFQSWDYAGITLLDRWSSDSQFFFLHDASGAVPDYILSVTSKEMQPIPVDQYQRAQWHPTQAVLAYLSEDQLTLSLLDAATMTVREVSLPTAFRDLVWRNSGDQIALVAEDGSVWLLDYPHLETLEQLSPPKPKVKDIIWSPDSTALSFISDKDIYIVDTNLEP